MNWFIMQELSLDFAVTSVTNSGLALIFRTCLRFSGLALGFQDLPWVFRTCLGFSGPLLRTFANRFDLNGFDENLELIGLELIFFRSEVIIATAPCSVERTTYQLIHKEIVHKKITELMCFIWVANWYWFKYNNKCIRLMYIINMASY